jgi:acyl-CoA thioesterase-2
MGDFDVDTTVTRVGEGRYQARLSREWEIWGPMGGYVATVALRAAGAESRFDRPASFFCHYLGVADFDVVDIAVEPLRQAKTAESLRVSITQGDRRIMEADVWATGDVDGLEHEHVQPPDVPDPDGLPTMQELMADQGDGPPFPFWNNFEPRPIRWNRDWPPNEPYDPIWQQWEKFIPRSTFDDPWVDAGRSVILVDVASWPAAHLPHAWKEPPFIAPTLDLYVAFHELVPRSENLLVDGHSPVGRDGLLGFTTRVWSEDRRLVSSGGGQMLCRRIAPPAAG